MDDKSRRSEYTKICRTGKIKYVSEASAIAADDYDGDGLYPYMCPKCGFWHLTKRRQ